eukprot:11230961-Ditylum_brightwellii.AAC.1
MLSIGRPTPTNSSRRAYRVNFQHCMLLEIWCKHEDLQDKTNIKKYNKTEQISTERVKDEQTRLL